MILSHYTKALSDLLESVDFSDPVRAIQLYTSAKVISEEMETNMEYLPEEERHEKHGYILEKLSLYTEYFGNAVMPIPGDHKVPGEWIEAARFNLLKVTIDTAD